VLALVDPTSEAAQTPESRFLPVSRNLDGLFVVGGIAGVIPDFGEGWLRKAQEPSAQVILGERLPLLGDNRLELRLGRQLHWLLQHDLLPVKMRGNRFHASDITSRAASTQTQRKALSEQRFRDRQATPYASVPREETKL
jgi:hypothetical protein